MIEPGTARTATSRRKIGIDDASAWVFNRMADVYDARPPYPEELVAALVELAEMVGPRIGDLGAGIGHLALPLAERGFDVTAIEPALSMLERLQAAAAERGLRVRTVHAAAEALPLEAASLDSVLIADAIHFVDTERAAHEIVRVLARRGALAVVTCEPAPTPFMRELACLMTECSTRRPRRLWLRRAQLFGVAKIAPSYERCFYGETPVTPDWLERILASVSFIGPAMNAERTAAFRERLHALPFPPVWAQRFTLHAGRKGGFRTREQVLSP